jgi:phage I-like protein
VTIRAGYLVDLRTIKFDDGDDEVRWIQAMPLGTYDHPLHGQIDITPERVQQFAANVNNRVRETDLDIDYDHKATGGDAAGWVQTAEARPDGLWVAIKWTKTAFQKLKEGAYRYFSPEFVDEWKHPKTGIVHKDVLFGGGITNRPFLKDILPINMTEVINHASGGTSMDPTEALKEITKLLGLPDGTDAGVVLGHIQAKVDPKQNPDPNDPNNPDQGGGGTPPNNQPPQTQQHSDKDADKGKSPVQLDEKTLMELPFVKQLMDTVTSQGKKLDESAVKEEIIKLSDLAASKQLAIPPVVKEGLEKQLSELPPTARPALIKLFEGMIEAGQVGVKLGEDGHANNDQNTTGTATKKFNEAIDKKMESEKGLSFMDAALAVANDDPQLYTSYQRELAGAN